MIKISRIVTLIRKQCSPFFERAFVGCFGRCANFLLIALFTFPISLSFVSAQEVRSSNARSTLIHPNTISATKIAIARYDKIVANGGWSVIPKGPLLREGSADQRILLVRRRLVLSGDMKPRRLKSIQFDSDVAAGVKRFQRRHGLKPSGILGRSTRRAMNVSARERLNQLRINWLRLSDHLEKIQGQKKYVLVNIPSFELQAIENDRLALVSRVVVGKTSTPTPELSASIRAINLLPYWHVPQSIATRALIPHIKKDINYLQRERLRVYSTSGGGGEVNPSEINWWQFQGERYVFRQDPGPQNALGLIRIDMPNKHIVYMHDTPLKKLFRYHARPFSAGCVRIQKIFELATWLAHADAGIDRNRIEAMINQSKQVTIKLAEQIPVHFVYITAWSKTPLFVEFRSDIYRKDGQRLVIASNDGWDTQVTKIMP